MNPGLYDAQSPKSICLTIFPLEFGLKSTCFYHLSELDGWSLELRCSLASHAPIPLAPALTHVQPSLARSWVLPSSAQSGHGHHSLCLSPPYQLRKHDVQGPRKEGSHRRSAFLPLAELQMCSDPGVSHVLIPQTSVDSPVRTVKDPKATKMCTPG